MFVATTNTPGYLPMDDDPPVFESARDAWRYLADERIRHEDDMADDTFKGFSATANTLEGIADGVLNRDDMGLDADWTGTIYGDTPGYDGDHDLGIAYSVTVTEDDDTEDES